MIFRIHLSLFLTLTQAYTFYLMLLNVCLSPLKTHELNPNSQGDGIKIQGLWEAIRS
jgi:hypothetical protein